MKEKIKNFLLKIKKFFTEKHTYSSIQLIIICVVINFLTMFLCYSEIMATDSCFNETHIEQVENVETERNIIDRDIKGANPTQSDYIHNDMSYDNIFFNTDIDYVINFFDNNTSLFYMPFSATEDVLPIYCYLNNQFSDIYHILLFSRLYYNSSYLYFINDVSILNGTIIENNVVSYLNSNYDSFDNAIVPFVAINSNGIYPNLELNGATIPIGFYNQQLYSIVSSIPFENNSTPTLENVPSSLVNTIPQNALTSTPSNLGTLIYDSGSNFVNLPTGHNVNTFGVQIYYKSSWTESYQRSYFTYEGRDYYFNDPMPTYSLSEVNVLIYTLWDVTPIYYSLGNVLDVPISNYAITSFDFFNWFNMLYTKVNVVNEYADFWHLDIDLDYEVEYQNTITGEYGNLISYIDYGFEMLIPHNVSLTDIGYKGFSMEKFVEFDSKYKDALVWLSQEGIDSIISEAVPIVYNNGYEKGDSYGFERGFELNGDSHINATNPVLNFINKGAQIVSDVLDVQVLPNITLGTIMLFPLVIALIWFIIKLFMGG